MANCDELAELLDTLLDGLGELLRIDNAMLWLFDSAQSVLTLLASRGYEIGGAGAEISTGEGIIGTAVREGVPIRVGHMMNMARYARAARDRADALGLRARAAAPRFRCPASRNRAASSPCRCAPAAACSARCSSRANTTSISATTTKTR